MVSLVTKRSKVSRRVKRFPLPYVSPTPLNRSFGAKIKQSSRKSKCKIILQHYKFYSTNAHLLPKLFLLLPKLIYESSLARTFSVTLNIQSCQQKKAKMTRNHHCKGVKTSYEDFLVTPLNSLCKGGISSTMFFVVKI